MSTRLVKAADRDPQLFGAGLDESGPEPRHGDVYCRGDVALHYGRAETCYEKWERPTCIVADGPYGVNGFPGDQTNWASLASFYEAHIKAWSARSTAQTTLWFWNTEVGWAVVHPLLVSHGWDYRCCNVWDKGMSHVAGNANTQTLRKFPVVTEVCAHYVKAARFSVGDRMMSMQDWLRYEWRRSGLPLHEANKACEVRNAATRKYLTADHLWYYPPPDSFEKLADYANRHGEPDGRPYFSRDGLRPIAADEWAGLRAKFRCPIGVTNVWSQPQVNGAERIQGERNGMKYKFSSLHGSQKPLRFVKLTIQSCTDEGDMVWEPFGGLCPGAVVSHHLRRKYVAAEIVPEFYRAAIERLARA